MTFSLTGPQEAAPPVWGLPHTTQLGNWWEEDKTKARKWFGQT